MANKSSKRSSKSDQPSKPGQTQAEQPGKQEKMHPQPETVGQHYRAAGKLDGQVAIVTGGDSGIGRSVAVLFAMEGADVAIVYLKEKEDAEATKDMITKEGRKALLIKGDISQEKFCQKVVDTTVDKFGRIDILVNNAAEQHPEKEFLNISKENLTKTFATNVFSMFYLSQAALPYLRKSPYASIINTTSVTAYRGSPGLIDYSATKGAIVSFTRSLSQALTEDKIRVNAVAPGPIWTPLIPATFPEEKVKGFGDDTPLGRAGEPYECGACFVFLASHDSSYLTGQVLHPNGGEIING